MRDGRLGRFLEAQEFCYPEVLAELRRARKTTHWMWFIFPQVAGLGSSAMSQRFAIGSLEETRAYLDHPVLGARLRECSDLLLGTSERSAEEIFGSIDAMKLRSCMTLFARAAQTERLFRDVLARYFDGVEDAATATLLDRTDSSL
jgi:uncharacterized protein (DUF1810 family)